MSRDGESHHERARAFLRVAHLYRLGRLPTEQPHPRTRDLSSWARDDLPTAVSVLKSVDLRALETLERYGTGIDRLAGKVHATLDAGGRVYLCGCGATGRLSLSLEFLWRQQHPGSEQVQSFMAGGDVALVHALEGFEDHPAYGARHLEQSGFSDGDLLIACTEGGETPYVIGAAERAAQVSSNRPFFLYCNDDSTLTGHIERFRRVHENPEIEKLCLAVGPMALAGSTRMQASTVLQLAVGVALFQRGARAQDLIATYRRRLGCTDFSFLPPFIEREAEIYLGGDHVSYSVRDYGITVLTDTTERAPTFSLVPFDQLEPDRPRHSLCYVALKDARTPAEAWTRLMNRTPRPLDWPEVDSRTTPEYLHGFDFSAGALNRRRRQLVNRTHHEFGIRKTRGGIRFRLGSLVHDLPSRGLPQLLEHLLLKQVLNIHSTLVMGRLGRYQGNLMTWVTPTNGKLVDRAARYVQHLLADAGQNGPSYGDIVQRLFVEMDSTPSGEPVVLSTYRALLRRNGTPVARARRLTGDLSAESPPSRKGRTSRLQRTPAE